MGLGPIIGFFWPFLIWCLVITFGLDIILNVIGTKCMYTGPEDEELWNVDDHFVFQSDDPFFGGSDFRGSTL